MQVIRVPSETLESLATDLGKKGASPRATKTQHEAFRLALGRTDIVGYRTGKVTFEDPQLLPLLEESLGEILPVVDHPVVGSDETGKGEWLGPLVVAACAVLPHERAPLVARGVMDSKDVSKGALPAIARMIEERQRHHATVVVAPERFNQLFAEFKAEGKGLNDLLAWAHAKALGDVLAQLEAAGRDEGARVLVDLFDKVRTEARTARAFDVDRYVVEQRPRAEDEVAVAAASILAKAARERWIDAYERRAGSPVRSLPRDRVLDHPDAEAFAKVAYLKMKR